MRPGSRRDGFTVRCRPVVASSPRNSARDAGIPIFLEWRLRECDYGELTGGPAERVGAAIKSHIEQPFPSA